MAQIAKIYENGAPSVLRLEDAQIPGPGAGEVKLAQQAIGVNYVDTMVRDGRFALPLPAVLGFEGAGVVTEVAGNVGDFRPGDRVGYFFAAGAYASERLIEAEKLIRLPDDISTEQAATFLAKGLTAWMALRALSSLKAGDTALVLGASGSVGGILSRWAKHLGATVIGVAGSADKLELVAAGADHAFHTGQADWQDRVRAIAPDGVDVVYDLVGRATADAATALVRSGGTIAAIGAASGPPAWNDSMIADRNISVKGGGTPQYVNAGTVGEASSELFALIRSGLFNDLPVVRYSLADIAQVHEAIGTRKLAGLPVLAV